MVQPSGEISVGTVIAETYVVTALLGMGGMGAVWTAEHRRLPGKRVAVKVLLGASTDAEALARFRREAEIASRIGHPNIVEVLDWNALPSGTPYMILEYLEGESLASRLRKGPLQLEHALEIIRQVGSALHAAHREQVVHRDLKPDNIFLCPTDSGGVLTDRVKVLDFGISKIRGSQTVQTQESALLGTPQYMSPEQAYGKNRSIDQRTDVWALGAIVYEMVAGEPAFSGETLAHVIMSIVNDPAPSLRGRPGVPERVAAAVERALQKDPEHRFPDVQSFIADLTGKPLQTLDRRAVKPSEAFGTPAADNIPTPVGPTSPMGFAPTQSPNSPTQPSGPPSVGTQPRGEVVAVPPTHRMEQPRPPSKAPMMIGIAAAVIGLGAGGYFAFLRPPPAHVEPPHPAANAAVTPPPPVEPPHPVEPAQKVAALGPPDPKLAKQLFDKGAAPTLDDLAGTPKSSKGGSPKSTAPAKESLSPEVVTILDAAEKAMNAGDSDGALHEARRSLSIAKSARAFSIITRTYCRAGDLGNAKANFAHVGGERANVVKFCKKHDIDLQ
jgi:serine/threonine-protein kinase